MPTPIRTDVRSLHRRLSLIIASQIAYLRKKQLENGRKLELDDVRQFKLLADALDDQIRIKRLLEADMKRDLEKLPDEKLEEIANAAATPADAATKPPESPPVSPGPVAKKAPRGPAPARKGGKKPR